MIALRSLPRPAMRSTCSTCGRRFSWVPYGADQNPPADCWNCKNAKDEAEVLRQLAAWDRFDRGEITHEEVERIISGREPEGGQER
jgi:hypothetical protein